MEKVSLIDGDSLVYIVAWNHKDSIPSLVEQSCDSLVKSILRKTGATHYFGSFSSDNNFRYDTYKVAPYKGTRPPKPDWVREWERWIKNHLIEKWHFIEPVGLEADDVISYLALTSDPGTYTICSPDKDMKQISGLHYDYKVTNNGIVEVSVQQAERNFWLQMLEGDDTDNLKGVPGLGKVKALKLLEGVDEPFDMHMTVYEAYCKYYGDYYGDIIYKQTYDCVQLMCPTHAYYQVEATHLEKIKQLGFYPVPKEEQDWPEI